MSRRRWRGAPGAGLRTVLWIGCGVAAFGGCEGDGGAPSAPPAVPAPTAPAPPPAPPVPVPPLPANVAATPGDGTVTLRWASPADGEGLTGFEVRVAPVGGPPPGDWIRLPKTARQHTFQSLTYGQPYVFEVRSVHDRGTPADPTDDVYGEPVSVPATLLGEPPPPATTWIGFSDRHVTLIEGGHVRLALPLSGERISLEDMPGFPVEVASDAPEGELRWLYTTAADHEGIGRYALELHAVRDADEEPPASYEVTLRGREPGIGISAGAGVLRVNVRDAAPAPACGALDLTSSGSRPADAETRTGEFVFEGPEGAALRIRGPYVTFLDNAPDDPPLPVISPVRLPYRELPDSGHRQEIRLHWSGELVLAAVAPGCDPVVLTCGAAGCDR